MTKNTQRVGGGLLGAPLQIDEWVTVEDTLPSARVLPAKRSFLATMRRLAPVAITGSVATFGLTVVKLAYLWPVMQVSINTAFPCLPQ